MDSSLKQSLFAIVMVAIATSLVSISVITDIRPAPSNLTYDEEDRYFLNEWKDAGGGEFATWGFPEKVLEQFDITARFIAPEVFFSKEFQNALYISQESFSIATDPTESLRQFDGRKTGESKFTFSIENEKRKMAAISRLRNPDDLPADVLDGLELQQKHFNRFNTISSRTTFEIELPSPTKTSPIDEAFKMLSPTDQQHLEPYLERLTDVPSILALSQEMSNEVRQAAFQLLFHAQERSGDPILRSPDASLTTHPDFVPVRRLEPNTVVTTIRLRRQIQSSLEGSISSLFSDTLEGVEVHSSLSAKGRAISRNLTPVPEGYILPESENYLVKESRDGSWWRYFSKTIFGGAVVLEQTERINLPMYEPNLSIAGNDAQIVYVQDKKRNWATFVAASNETSRFRFAADGRLEAEQKEAFIEFCRRMIEADT